MKKAPQKPAPPEPLDLTIWIPVRKAVELREELRRPLTREYLYDLARREQIRSRKDAGIVYLHVDDVRSYEGVIGRPAKAKPALAPDNKPAPKARRKKAARA